MGLTAPNLDDRRFQDLVDDAKRQIARRSPEWTDHNVSDPGVTLIELHISNVHRREELYHHSLISKVSTAVIAGLGADGYPMAVSAMVRLLEASPSKPARP